MIDINDLIKELTVSVEQIIRNDWNPKGVSSSAVENEYQAFIPVVTSSTIKYFQENKLGQALYDLECVINGVSPSLERCNLVAKKLSKARESHQAKLFHKGRREKRNMMNSAIKEITIPFLRKKGFKGTFPNFKLEEYNRSIDLQFQFSLFSPQFVVEIKSTALRKGPLRLGSIKNQKDYWYNFDSSGSTLDIYKFRAQEVIDNWEEAESWINEKL